MVTERFINKAALTFLIVNAAKSKTGKALTQSQAEEKFKKLFSEPLYAGNEVFSPGYVGMLYVERREKDDFSGVTGDHLRISMEWDVRKALLKGQPSNAIDELVNNYSSRIAKAETIPFNIMTMSPFGIEITYIVHGPELFSRMKPLAVHGIMVNSPVEVKLELGNYNGNIDSKRLLLVTQRNVPPIHYLNDLNEMLNNTNCVSPKEISDYFNEFLKPQLHSQVRL